METQRSSNQTTRIEVNTEYDAIRCICGDVPYFQCECEGAYDATNTPKCWPIDSPATYKQAHEDLIRRYCC